MSGDVRPGYTLVEVVVAFLVLAVGVLALAASSAVVAKTMESNALRERAGRIAASRIELLRSQCANAAGGDEMIQQIQSTWTASRGSPIASIVESVRYVSAGGLHTQTYRAEAWCPE
jgi:Tfp pilus assembly protein PilV